MALTTPVGPARDRDHRNYPGLIIGGVPEGDATWQRPPAISLHPWTERFRQRLVPGCAGESVDRSGAEMTGATQLVGTIG